MSRRDRKIYRDTTDQKIGGVCSGLARYFELDPLLVRIGFVAGLLFSGVTFVAYILLWWLVDPAPAGYWSTETDDEGEAAASAGSFPPPAQTGEPTDAVDVA